jgi:C4-dicarboxylate-specific signal transduction histidine kinase
MIAIGFDRTELEQHEHAIYQKARLTMIGEMSTSLAHEMAQPLSVINLASNLIRNPKVPEEGKEEARERLMLAAERVKRTVDRMKIFARKGPVDASEAFAVRDAIESTVALTMTDLKFAGIDLTTELNFSDVTARGSNILLEQVLLNLIMNARDAILGTEHHGAGIIVVRAERLSPDQLLIVVSDNGPGIPKEIHSRLFEPFFTTKEGGTGLGLALAHGIVRDMGGTIRIRDQEVGAGIEIRLPVRAMAN